MSEPLPAASKRPRGPYSRLICLNCRERRIRCELPPEVDIPDQGELWSVQTPCYRCKRLDIPCVVRQTVLGRPGPERCSSTAADCRLARTGDIVPRPLVGRPSRTAAHTQLASVHDETQPRTTSVLPQSMLRTPNNLPPTQGDSRDKRSDAIETYNPLHAPVSHASFPPPPAKLGHMNPAKVQILPLRRALVPTNPAVSCRGTPSPGCSDGRVTAAKRGRASKPKVRTGCLTCRIRRVKLTRSIVDDWLVNWSLRRLPLDTGQMR